MALMLVSITLDCSNCLSLPVIGGFNVSWQKEITRHEELVLGGQEVKRFWQGSRSQNRLVLEVDLAKKFIGR